MNFNEIKAILEELEITPEMLAYGDFDEASLKTKVGDFKEVYQFGGEGQGDSLEHVYHFIDHDVYIEMDGYYESHYGSEWGDSVYYQVKPVQVMRTEYQAVR